MITSIETTSRLARHGGPVVGRRSVLRKHPPYRPAKLKSPPNPLVHAPSKEARRSFLAAYLLFVRAFRAAADLLHSGDMSAVIPEACFASALPFVAVGQGARPR